jgi:hypothetical protein
MIPGWRKTDEGKEIMNDPTRTRPLLSLFTLATIAVGKFFARGPALACRFFLYKLETPDVGLASAGYAACAQASTLQTCLVRKIPT